VQGEIAQQPYGCGMQAALLGLPELADPGMLELARDS